MQRLMPEVIKKLVRIHARGRPSRAAKYFIPKSKDMTMKYNTQIASALLAGAAVALSAQGFAKPNSALAWPRMRLRMPVRHLARGRQGSAWAAVTRSATALPWRGKMIAKRVRVPAARALQRWTIKVTPGPIHRRVFANILRPPKAKLPCPSWIEISRKGRPWFVHKRWRALSLRRHHGGFNSRLRQV